MTISLNPPAPNQLTFTVVDAFTTQPFRGNPAAVIVLPPSPMGSYKHEAAYPVRDDVLQAVALQLNITETAFLVPIPHLANSYRLRWFAPWQEIRLCGHATLASAFHLFTRHLTQPNGLAGDENLALVCGTPVEKPQVVQKIHFHTTWSGVLTARLLRVAGRKKSISQHELLLSSPSSATDNFRVEIELPAGTPVPLITHNSFPSPRSAAAAVREAVNRAACIPHDLILDVLIERDHPSYKEYVVVILDPSVDIQNLNVNAGDFIPLDPLRLIILTNRKPMNAPVPGYFIRVFCPLWGVPEDPVCGSANCLVARYWATHLGLGPNVEMSSSQTSMRHGELGVVWDEEKGKVKLRGHARVAARGEIML